MNLLKFANVPLTDAVNELQELPLDQVLFLPEPHRTATIEEIVKSQSAELHFVENLGKEFTVTYQNKPLVVKKGNEPYPLPVALYLLTKYGEGTDKTYGKTKRSDLVSGAPPEGYKKEFVEDKLADKSAELKQAETDLKVREKEMAKKEKELEVKFKAMTFTTEKTDSGAGTKV